MTDFLRLTERLEYRFLQGFGNAESVIPNKKDRSFSGMFQAEGNPAAGRSKLESIGEEIDQNTLAFFRIGLYG